MRVPRRTSQWTKKGCEKFDLIPMACTRRQHCTGMDGNEGAYLMVYVMVVRVISAHHLERIKGEIVSTVIVDSLTRAERKEENSLSN
jgi:hypothetical protein